MPSTTTTASSSSTSLSSTSSATTSSSSSSTTGGGETVRTPLLPTENFENTLLDGVTTVNVFELDNNNNNDDSSYQTFTQTIRSRLVEICCANPWLLGRLEQTKKFTTKSPLHGEFDVVWKRNLSQTEIEQFVDQDIFVESPSDITKGFLTSSSSKSSMTCGDVSPFVDLTRFVATSSTSTSTKTSKLSKFEMDSHFSARSYDALSTLLKTPSSSTSVMKAPDSAKRHESLFRVVMVPAASTDNGSNYAYVIVSLSHAIADGQTYFQILHMLLHSTDRRTPNTTLPIKSLIFDVKATTSTSHASSFTDDDMTNLVKNYKRERSNAIPEAKMIDQMKLGGAIGVKSLETKLTKVQQRQLISFVVLVDSNELNQLKSNWSTQDHQDAASLSSSISSTTMATKPPKLSANDILVTELGKLMNVNRLDTNVDCRVKVLHERMKFDKSLALDAAGNCVAMLPFFRKHFTNPWYIRKAMIRDDGTYQADPVDSIPYGDLPKRTESYIVGNLSNWSGFTVGTQLGGGMSLMQQQQHQQQENSNDSSDDADKESKDDETEALSSQSSPPSSPSPRLVLHLPINVTASGSSPFEQALVFAPFQDKPKQLAVVFSTHYFDELVARIDDPNYKLLKPFVTM